MENNLYSAVINDTESLEIRTEELKDLDLLHTSGAHFHLLHEGSAYQIEVLEADYQKKLFYLNINGKRLSVLLSDRFDTLVKKMGLNLHEGQKVKDIKAPMPGMVLDILVEEGQNIEKGDPMIILEAMKMENVIKAGGDGIVKKIFVKKSNAVEKNAMLIELD